MRDLAHGERVRDDADHRAAGVEHRVGERAHQADVAAAIDERQVTGGDLPAHLLSRVEVSGITPWRGAAEDTDALHAFPS